MEFIGFLCCALVIIFAGSKLSVYGDLLAEKTGLGKSFIGLILLATVTSLPELITGVSSVMLVNAPDIAAGDVLGSCVFNLFILALLDLYSKDQPISSRAGNGHIITSMLGIILLTVTASSLIFRKIIPAIAHIGLYSIFFMIIYFVALRLVFLYEKDHLSEALESIHQEKYSLRKIIYQFLLYSLIIVISAIFLPHFGKQIADHTGLGESFFGTLFIAASTSLPELAVSISAVRIGAVNLAFSNLLGSNLFNIFILSIDDILYFQGPILSYISSSHLISIFTAILMTAFICIGIVFKVNRKTLFLSFDSLAIIVIYIIGMFFLYYHK